MGADEETTVVPFGTTVQTSTWRIAIVAGMTMIVMAGGGVLMLQTTDGGLTTTAVEQNGDNLGFSCCKKNSVECDYPPEAKWDYCIHACYDGPGMCRHINGYDGPCHKGAGDKPYCCTDKDQGTFHFHIDPGKSSCT